MGSPTSENGRSTNETEHNVTLTKGFYLGKYEVTQAEYEAVMTGNSNGLSATPSQYPGNPNRPVEKVSWDDVQVFLSRLNDAEQTAGRLPTGWEYVLPTESEWEYACRAGTTTMYSWGATIASSNANYNWDASWNTGSDFKQTRDVGQYAANPWGFFDMHGNVFEWTADGYNTYPSGPVTDPSGATSGSARVARGGSWESEGTGLRSAERDNAPPSYRHYSLGFRVGFKQTNDPPVFSNPPSVSVLENQTLALTVTASDPDGDSLTYSLAGGPDEVLFELNSFNSSTGLLTFKNAPDFEANASAAGNNSYSVTVQVTDGTSPVTQALTINLSDVYEPFVARQGTDRMGSAFVRSYLKLNEKLVLGFEVTGGQAEVLIKGLGPSYAGTGLPHAVSDPMVSLFDSGGQPILANDDWMSGPRAIHLTEASLTPASPKEAALLVTLSPGTYSVLCEANGAEEGMTGVEVREVGGSPGVGLNVLRANGSVSPQNPLVQGITVEGPNPRKLMIRAKGESSLGHQGVTSALKDPVLSASAHDQASGSYSLIAENGDWESGHRASEVAQTGFAPSTGSTDAVLLLDLVPGSYLFEANDQNGSGNGLVVTEVYDLGPGQSALDRPPVGIKLSVHEVPENAPLGTVVGVIGSTDPEVGSSPSHMLHDPQGTSDNGLFVLDADGSLRTATVFDYEKNATYRIAVRATDDANSFSDAVLEIRVTDLFRPIAQTGLAESLTGVSATLKGEVVDDGGMGVTLRGFVFSNDPDPELGKSGVFDLPAGQGTGLFSAQATGLEPGRKYYFRAYAENVEGTGYGSDGEFVTLSDGPGWIDATPGEAKDWWTSPWLGSFFRAPNGWVRHAQLGWVFPVESPTAGIWLWKDGMGWLWTDKGVYPFLYGANGSGWHYFYGLHEGTTLFFDYQSKKWRTLE